MTNWNEVVRVVEEYLDYVDREEIDRYYYSMVDGMSEYNIEKNQKDESTAIGILFKNDCIGLAYMSWDELKDEMKTLISYRDKQNLAEKLSSELKNTKSQTQKTYKI